MNIKSKQRIAMAVIVLAGGLGIGAVLLTQRAPTAAAETEHADDHAEAGKPEKGHAEAGHTDKEAPAERQVKLSEAQRNAAGITVRTAGPATLQSATRFPGEIRFDDDRTAHVLPRLAGVAQAVPASLGQRVEKGQLLAVIASTGLSDLRSELLTAQRRREAARATFEREKKLWQDKISAEQDYLQAQTALQEADIAVQNAGQKLAAVGATPASTGLNRFEVRAPFAGTIVEKHLSQGESAAESATIFTVSDLSTVWAEFAVSAKDLAAVRVGQKVTVSSTAFDSQVEGTVSYVGALLGEQTRAARARVTVANPAGAWRPGLFVTVAVRGENQAVPLAVNADAVQTVDGVPTLFIVQPGGFVARAVTLGRNDGKTVEVLGGLKPGEAYAAANAFVLKSELGKAGAEHGH